ncbi:hypothetical protein EJ04DRAFT_551071 [Polyplosphaeria fusca]|uniref:DUF7730 domain-containing protein n=1 Tax=Polyplosphaeria fusca TaxID=682080 RepID=A0A9P4V1T6_9PLEO|nr:hypothetical protein EJ04DRAFT_551071 [Polyplosphaeria fusca]
MTRYAQKKVHRRHESGWFYVVVAGVLICASPLIIAASPALCAFKAYSCFVRSEAYKKRDRQKDCKPPKTVKRKRALSIGAGGKHGKPINQVTAEQESSPLFRLPLELRRAIYEELIGEGDVHMIWTWQDMQLKSFRCLRPDTHAKKGWRHEAGAHCWLKNSFPKPSGSNLVYTFQQSGTGVVPALQSCRRVYSEMIDLVYSTPTFLIHDYDSFVMFTASILPARFAAIESLHFDNRDEGEDRLLNRSLSASASYRILRGREARNTLLPPLDPTELGNGAFRALCEIVCAMKGRKKLWVTLDHRRLPVGGDVQVLFEQLEEAGFKDCRLRIHGRDG